MDRGGAYYYVYDDLGSVRALTNGAGTVTDTYAYDAFGNTTHGLGSSPNSYQFNGQANDGTGLYFLRARYYNPGDGRFLSQDPLMGSDSDPASLHRYLYASGDPVNRMDPGGKEDFSLSGVMAASSMAASLGGILDAAEFAIKDQFAAAAGVDISQEKVIAVSIVDSTGLSNEWVAPLEQSVQNLEMALIIFQLASNVANLGKAAAQANGNPPFSKFEQSLSSSDDELAELAGEDDAEGGSNLENDEDESGGGCQYLCLVAGSRIEMADGTVKTVETLQPHDQVLSRNPQNGKTEPEFVTETISRKSAVLVTLTFVEPRTSQVVEKMTCTPGHPIYVQGKGWVPAGMLISGDPVVTRTGSSFVVGTVTWQRDEKHGFTVYNLVVEEDHTYFVGLAGGGVWVHNGCADDADSGKLGDNLRAAGQHPPVPGQFQAHHIVEGTRGESGKGYASAVSSHELFDLNSIDINTAENGIWLPNKNAQAPFTGISHNMTMNKEPYSDRVFNHLTMKLNGAPNGSPQARQRLLEGLAEIKTQLGTGAGGNGFSWP